MWSGEQYEFMFYLRAPDGYGKKENEPETAEGEQPIEAMNTGPEVANTGITWLLMQGTCID